MAASNILTVEQWQRHLLPDHPELLGLEALVEAALTAQTQVAFDAIYARRENFCCREALPPPYERLYLKGCVGFEFRSESGAPSGFVITAYPTERIKRSEVVKWP